jgi:5-formyltetrahydrofolate cyclo-ligase
MTTAELKNQIRGQIREKKKLLLPEDRRRKSVTIFQKIEQLEAFRKSRVVMVYWSLSDEVFTHDFILKWYQLKTILLPVIKGDELGIKQFSALEILKAESRLGIQEPTGEEYDHINPIDLIIVPGMAFDLKNNRLGRGKAYYDKFLAGQNGFKIGVCFDFQLLKKIPTIPSDIAMDLVVTNRN